MAGAGYVVVPGGQGEGSLPAGITRAWLQEQMSQMFGSPMILGSGSTSIWVWRMSSPQPAVTTAPAVAEVELRNVGHPCDPSGARSARHPRGLSRELRQQPVPRRSGEPSRQGVGTALRQQHVPVRLRRHGGGDGADDGSVDSAHHQRRTAVLATADRPGSSQGQWLEPVRPIPGDQRHQQDCHRHRDRQCGDPRAVLELVIPDSHRPRCSHHRGQ